MTERRTARRYEMTLPISIRAIHGEDGTGQTGRTHNLSTRGISFSVDHDVTFGTVLDLMVLLTSPDKRESNVMVQAKGTVVRVEHRLENVVVAAVLQKCEIVRKDTTRSWD